MSAPPKVELPTEEEALVGSLVSFGGGDKVKVAYAKPHRVKLIVAKENLLDVARYARNNTKLDHVTNITYTDFPKDNQFEITYHFGSIDGSGLRALIVGLSCRIPRSDPILPSLIQEFPGTEYHEREAAEMLGCVFDGHPNLTRFLLPEDWNDIPPMLKAYRLPGRLEGE